MDGLYFKDVPIVRHWMHIQVARGGNSEEVTVENIELC